MKWNTLVAYLVLVFVRTLVGCDAAVGSGSNTELDSGPMISQWVEYFPSKQSWDAGVDAFTTDCAESAAARDAQVAQVAQVAQDAQDAQNDSQKAINVLQKETVTVAGVDVETPPVCSPADVVLAQSAEFKHGVTTRCWKPCPCVSSCMLELGMTWSCAECWGAAVACIADCTDMECAACGTEFKACMVKRK